MQNKIAQALHEYVVEEEESLKKLNKEITQDTNFAISYDYDYVKEYLKQYNKNYKKTERKM